MGGVPHAVAAQQCKDPPYTHNGTLDTLEDVVEFYSAGGRPNPNLSPLIRPLFLDGYEI